MDAIDLRVVLFGLAILAGAASIYYQRKVEAIDELPRAQIEPRDIPEIARLLSTTQSEGSFAAFLFESPDRPSYDDTMSAQLSFEDGTLGFDWVLLAPRNVEEQERVTRFAAAQGFELRPKRGNGVDYLRVEQGDVAQLCIEVITGLFEGPASGSITMVRQGFDWPAAQRGDAADRLLRGQPTSYGTVQPRAGRSSQPSNGGS